MSVDSITTAHAGTYWDTVTVNCTYTGAGQKPNFLMKPSFKTTVCTTNDLLKDDRLSEGLLVKIGLSLSLC